MFQEPKVGAAPLLDLGQRALTWGLVGTPAQKRGAVAKAAGAEMIVGDFHHQRRLERLPFAGAPRTPAAWTARRPAGETGRLHELLQFPGQAGALSLADRRRVADMVPETLLVIQSEQQGSDNPAARGITKAAHDTIGAAHQLDLDHGVALAGPVRTVEPLGNDAVQIAAHREIGR